MLLAREGEPDVGELRPDSAHLHVHDPLVIKLGGKYDRAHHPFYTDAHKRKDGKPWVLREGEAPVGPVAIMLWSEIR